VLRGPLAQLYGNAAGGVVQVFSEHRRDCVPTVSTFQPSAWALTGRPSSASSSAPEQLSATAWLLDAMPRSTATDGYREHSETRRAHADQRPSFQTT
jgi:iron complex outermembrane receptor protein